MGKNVKISKIKASAQNCAAFTEKEKVYLWGCTASGKMGLSRDNIEEPREVFWEIINNGEGEPLELRTIIKKDDDFRQKDREYMNKIRCIEWGEEHGLILDKKGTLFGMGRTNYGLLGLEDREYDEFVTNPK